MYRIPGGPMMHNPLSTPSIILNCLFMLITLAGFAFFVVTAWRFMRAHEQLASAVKDIAISVKPKE